MEILQKWWSAVPDVQATPIMKLLSTFLIIFSLWIIHIVINRIVAKQTENVKVRYTWRQASLYTTLALGIFLVGRQWILGLHSILTVLGLIAAGLTIAHKEMLLNLAGWGTNFWRGVFTEGDRIQIGSHQGDVVATGILYFTLLEIGNWSGGDQSTGRIIKVPNSLIHIEPIINYTKSFPYIWNEVSVIITPKSDWKRAESLLLEIGNAHIGEIVTKAEQALKHLKNEVIVFKTLTPSVYIKLNQSKPAGIELTLRYLCKPRQRRNTEQNIYRSVLEKFQQNQINLSYEGWE